MSLFVGIAILAVISLIVGFALHDGVQSHPVGMIFLAVDIVTVIVGFFAMIEVYPEISARIAERSQELQSPHFLYVVFVFAFLIFAAPLIFLGAGKALGRKLAS